MDGMWCVTSICTATWRWIWLCRRDSHRFSSTAGYECAVLINRHFSFHDSQCLQRSVLTDLLQPEPVPQWRSCYRTVATSASGHDLFVHPTFYPTFPAAYLEVHGTNASHESAPHVLLQRVPQLNFMLQFCFHCRQLQHVRLSSATLVLCRMRAVPPSTP